MADYADLLAAEANKKPEQNPPSSGAVIADKKPQRTTPKTTHQTKDVRHDVMTPQHDDVDYRSWRDIIGLPPWEWRDEIGALRSESSDPVHDHRVTENVSGNARQNGKYGSEHGIAG